MAAQSNTKKNNSGSRSASKSKTTSSRSGSTGRSSGGSNKSRTGSRSGGRASGSKKGNGGNGGGNGSDRLTNIFLLLLLITVIVLAVLYFKNKGGEAGDGTPTPTGQAQPGGLTPQPEEETPQSTKAAQPQEEPTPSPTAQPTQEAPDGTQAPSETPALSPTAAPTPQASPSGQDYIQTAEADEILADVFWEEGYRFTLSDSDFAAGGTAYYRYDAFYGSAEEPYDVLVRKSDGELYYYENGALKEFDGVPEHAKEPDADGETPELTSDEAAELLRQFPYTSLGLPAPLDECSLVLDNWKTVVDGVECSCLNVFYNGTLAGSIYFTGDAAHVYYLDEFGEFVKVR